MALNREDIITLARRYISMEEIVTFPMRGDLFCFLQRPVTPSSNIENDDEKWQFSGYGVSLGYDYDHETKPQGKWILFYYLTLNKFPPTAQVIKLQPPHIAKGIFNTADRSGEIKVVSLPLSDSVDSPVLGEEPEPNNQPQPEGEHTKKDNIIQFPGTNRKMTE